MSSAGALGGVGFLADEMAAALATMYAGLASPRLAASEFGITAPLEVIEAQALSDAYEVARAAAQALPWLRDAQADAVASDDVGAVARTSAALIAGLAQVIATASALAPALATAAACIGSSQRCPRTGFRSSRSSSAGQCPTRSRWSWPGCWPSTATARRYARRVVGSSRARRRARRCGFAKSRFRVRAPASAGSCDVPVAPTAPPTSGWRGPVASALARAVQGSATTARSTRQRRPADAASVHAAPCLRSAPWTARPGAGGVGGR